MFQKIYSVCQTSHIDTSLPFQGFFHGIWADGEVTGTFNGSRTRENVLELYGFAIDDAFFNQNWVGAGWNRLAGLLTLDVGLLCNNKKQRG